MKYFKDYMKTGKIRAEQELRVKIPGNYFDLANSPEIGSAL